MSTGKATRNGDSSENNAPLPPELTNTPSETSRIMTNSGWLCGYRVDNINGPQVLAHRVASCVDGLVPFIEEKNEIRTEVITTHNKRESNYVHHGWSIGAIATTSPWTSARIDATNQPNAEGTWVTRRTLVSRLRVQVPPQDLTPAPEFTAAIEEALGLPTRFEKFRAVYHALSRWGDVVPLEMEIGSSLALTDTDQNFAQLPTALCNNLDYLSTIRTANTIRKGATSNAGWNDGTWTTIGIPALEWRPITIVTVFPTIGLLTDGLQAQLAELYAERLSYIPSLTIDPIIWQHEMYDDTINASRTILQVAVWMGAHIDRLSVTYLDGVVSRGGGRGGAKHTPFVLANGEHIIEMLTCIDGGWLRGIQFITNTGRCSATYGRLEGIPTITRSKGGILAGFSVRTKIDTGGNEATTGVGGIWRHDFISRVPKENDVYSEYFGARAQNGTNFNDRTLIGNSSSISISSVEVRSGADIDSIQFTYKDTRDGRNSELKTERHGGSGGGHHQFKLRDGEYIVSVSGRYNDQFLTQLCFGTNHGRTSEIYGTGGSRPFSARAPLGENGRYLQLHYILGKSSNARLNGVMFVWTPDLQ